MPYKRSNAETNYLRRMYARRREEETGCDCPGGQHCPRTSNPCAGFVRNCTCDEQTTTLDTDPSTSTDIPPY